MANVTLRLVKGSPLTNAEVDNNFSNLNIFKVEIGGDLSGNNFTPTVSAIQGRSVADIAPSNGQALIWISGSNRWEPGNVATSASGLANVFAGTGVTAVYDGSNATLSIGQNVSTTANVTFHSLFLNGNLTVLGNATTINSNSLSINDPLIYLAGNNYISDLVDIGFVGNYYDGVLQRHAGLFRDASDGGKFKLFANLNPEPTNTIDTDNVTFRYATLVLDTLVGNVIGSASSVEWANVASKPSPFVNVTLSGDVTGTANVLLNSLTGNTLTLSTTIAPNSVALGTDTTGAYVSNVIAGTGISITGNDGSEGATPTISLPNTGVSATTYGNASIVPVITVDAQGRITSASNVAISLPSTVTFVGVYTGAVSNAQLLDAIKNVDGSGSGLDADLLDGQTGTYYSDWTNITNKPSPFVNVTMTGDVTGTANVLLNSLTGNTLTISTTIGPNSVALGTDTTGAYLSNVIAGTGITISGNDGSEGAAPTISLPTTGVSASTYGNATIVPVITVDAQGRITSASNVTIQPTQQTFSTVNVNAAVDLVADSTSDVLYLTGSNVTLTPTAGTDTVNFSIPQSVATTSSVTFAGLTVNGNVTAGNVNLQDNLLQRPKVIDYSLKVNALGSISGTVSIDLIKGNFITATATGAITTLTFDNPIAAPDACGFILELTNGGAFSITWPAATKWPGGTVPTLTSSGVDVLVFITDDGGTTWRGAVTMKDSK